MELIELDKSYHTASGLQVDIVAKLNSGDIFCYVGVVRRPLGFDYVAYYNDQGQTSRSEFNLTSKWYELFNKTIHAVVFDDNSFSTYQTKELAQKQAKNSSFSDARYALLKIEEVFDAT